MKDIVMLQMLIYHRSAPPLRVRYEWYKNPGPVPKPVLVWGEVYGDEEGGRRLIAATQRAIRACRAAYASIERGQGGVPLWFVRLWLADERDRFLSWQAEGEQERRVGVAQIEF